MISSYNLSFINSYLPTAFNKYFRYATSNKLYFSIYYSPFVKTFLETTELTRRQPINILKVRIIIFIQTIKLS